MLTEVILLSIDHSLRVPRILGSLFLHQEGVGRQVVFFQDLKPPQYLLHFQLVLVLHLLLFDLVLLVLHHILWRILNFFAGVCSGSNPARDLEDIFGSICRIPPLAFVATAAVMTVMGSVDVEIDIGVRVYLSRMVDFIFTDVIDIAEVFTVDV